MLAWHTRVLTKFFELSDHPDNAYPSTLTGLREALAAFAAFQSKKWWKELSP
jgi:hypothetical protein